MDNWIDFFMSKKYNDMDIAIKRISYQAEKLADGLTFFDFYDPSQQMHINRELRNGYVYPYFFGGHSLCERKMLCLSSEKVDNEEKIIWPMSLCVCKINFPVDHRMVLGAVMSLGITRETLGDIIIDEDRIQIVAKDHIAQFIAMNIEKLNNHKVHFKDSPIENIIISEPKTTFFNVSVASLRLDAIISSACGMSREVATEIIKKGKVKINHEEKTKPSQIAEIGDLFSVRGIGRFLLEESIGTTKKGRIKITIKKFV